MSTQHARFQARLIDSRPAVEAVAAWLRRRGRVVFVPPIHVASSADVAWLWRDHGDIILDGSKTVQVKGLRKTLFPPWDHPHVFISSRSQVEDTPDAWAWVIVSNDLKACGVILPSTRAGWYLTRVRCETTGNVETFYACPYPDVIWRKLIP